MVYLNKLSVISFMLTISCTLNDFVFPWDTPCAFQCTCDDAQYQITCYNYDETAPFVDISNSKTNRSFSKLFLNGFSQLQSSSFKNVPFNLFNNASLDRIYINFRDVKKIHANAFDPMGNLTGFNNYFLDIEITTPLRLIADSFAFSNTFIRTLTFNDIKALSNETYMFNLGSLLGSKRIEKLELKRCSLVTGFYYDSIEISNLCNNDNCKVNVTSFEVQEFKLAKLTPQTIGNKVILVANLEIIKWTDGQLDTIEQDTFEGMEGLKTLILSNNQIKKIDSYSFRQSRTSLEELDLSFNPIEQIDKLAFSSLKNLKTINLFKTNLSQVPADLFSSLVSLENLKISNQINLNKFDWNSLTRLNNLKTINLSFMKSKNVILDEDMIQNEADVIVSVLSKLSNIWLNGYNFTNKDGCLFSGLDSKNIKLGFTNLDLAHECNCFVIQAYKYYRLSINQSLSSIETFKKALNTTPICYRQLYDLTNNQDINNPSINLLDKEKECKILNTEMCTAKVTTIEPKTTTTRIELEETNSKDDLNYAILIITTSGLSVVVVILIVVVIYLKKSLNLTTNQIRTQINYNEEL